MKNLGVVILAAGKGTRMESDLPKVLHKIQDKSMVRHVITKAKSLETKHIHVVVGHKAQLVKDELKDVSDLVFVEQKQLLGTGDAVKSALPCLSPAIDHVLVLCGDVPLIRSQTLSDLTQTHISKKAKLTLLAVNMENPAGYGRVVCDKEGKLDYIREQADASEEEKKINLVNTGIYCFEKKFLADALSQIRPDNNQAEYYLTDLVEIGRETGQPMEIVITRDAAEVGGINTRAELSRAISLLYETTNKHE